MPLPSERLRHDGTDRRVVIDVIDGEEPSPESSSENAQFQLIANAVGMSHPAAETVPYIMMAATDSRHFHRSAPAVYRLAPPAMSAELRATIHGVDERVAIDELERGARFHRSLIESLPGGDSAA